MALRYPGTYRDLAGALEESRCLNEWIETVLASTPSGRVRAVAGGADSVAGKGKRREWTSRLRSTPGAEGAGKILLDLMLAGDYLTAPPHGEHFLRARVTGL
ncbi:hypothetical protein [Roseomonas sp. KE2513]|uniref:hypothetical protein n=1 Tax=Roseomonas sp. KE2513 TaxID=2479202 RepID=UPI0035CB022C